MGVPAIAPAQDVTENHDGQHRHVHLTPLR
jgi:hypothetical protein